MIVFSYYPDTFEFAGYADAYESPLEPGVYLIPGNATAIEPPAFDTAVTICKFDEAAQEWLLSERPAPEPEPEPEQPPAYTPSELARMQRTQLLYMSDWMMTRHNDELLMGVTPVLTPTNLSAVLAYRQALRDLPTADGFPECSMPVLMWPTSP
jgi:hypothetical protein